MPKNRGGSAARKQPSDARDVQPKKNLKRKREFHDDAPLPQNQNDNPIATDEFLIKFGKMMEGDDSADTPDQPISPEKMTQKEQAKENLFGFSEIHILSEGPHGKVSRVMDKKDAVFSMKTPTSTEEREFLTCLKELENYKRFHAFFMEPLSNFYEEGIHFQNYENGILFENCMESLETILMERKGKGKDFSLCEVQSMAEQLIGGLHFCHTNGFCHGNLTTKIILMRIKTKNDEKVSIKLIDAMGRNGTAIVGKDINYSAPEAILGNERSAEADVWSIACILFELYQGHSLFQAFGTMHLFAQMVAVLGPFPKDKAYNTTVCNLKDWNKTEGNRSAVMEMFRPLEEYKKDISGGDLFGLLRRMLDFNHEERIRLGEALDHAFLTKNYNL